MNKRTTAQSQELTTIIQIDAGAQFARVRVIGDNRASDVRLRVGFASGLATRRVVADAAYGPVERKPIIAPPDAKEHAPPTAPLHRYVSAYSPVAGVTVYSDGLAEYDADADGTMWVTLLRAVGELSRHNLPERPGHAGYPVETPDAQSIGAFAAGFGFLVHGPSSDDTTTTVERMSDDVLHPIRGEPGGRRSLRRRWCRASSCPATDFPARQ